jgi:hypothetical protein
MKEALSSPETSVLKRSTWHNIPEDTILRVEIFLNFFNSWATGGFQTRTGLLEFTIQKSA